VFGLKERGTLGAQLSLWNLRPALSAQFFHTNCAEWSPENYQTLLPEKAESWFARSDTENVLVAVVCREVDINWGNYQNISDTVYDLLLLHWNPDAKYLALYASDYSGLKSERMAVAVTDDNTRLISGDPVFNVLNNVELPLVKGLGSSRIGAISFTSYFGPNVTDGLARSRSRSRR
jgi:hypothetical protein